MFYIGAFKFVVILLLRIFTGKAEAKDFAVLVFSGNVHYRWIRSNMFVQVDFAQPVGIKPRLYYKLSYLLPVQIKFYQSKRLTCYIQLRGFKLTLKGELFSRRPSNAEPVWVPYVNAKKTNDKFTAVSFQPWKYLKLHSHQTPDQPTLIPDQFWWLGRVWSGKKLPALIEEGIYPRSTTAVSALYPWCTLAQIPLFPTYPRPSDWPIPALHDQPPTYSWCNYANYAQYRTNPRSDFHPGLRWIIQANVMPTDSLMWVQYPKCAHGPYYYLIRFKMVYTYCLQCMYNIYPY